MLSLCRFRTGNSVTAAPVWIYEYGEFAFLVVYGAVPGSTTGVANASAIVSVS
jgi:hypothetical protein